MSKWVYLGFNLLIFSTLESFDFSDMVTSHFSFSFPIFFFANTRR